MLLLVQPVQPRHLIRRERKIVYLRIRRDSFRRIGFRERDEPWWGALRVSISGFEVGTRGAVGTLARVVRTTGSKPAPMFCRLLAQSLSGQDRDGASPVRAGYKPE